MPLPAVSTVAKRKQVDNISGPCTQLVPGARLHTQPLRSAQSLCNRCPVAPSHFPSHAQLLSQSLPFTLPVALPKMPSHSLLCVPNAMLSCKGRPASQGNSSSDFLCVCPPADVPASDPVRLVSALGQGPPRLNISSQVATRQAKEGLVCLVAVACDPSGTPLEGVYPGCSKPFQVIRLPRCNDDSSSLQPAPPQTLKPPYLMSPQIFFGRIY